MVVVAQLVRAPGCGPGGRRFKSGLPPHFTARGRAVAARQAHNLKVNGSIPFPATIFQFQPVRSDRLFHLCPVDYAKSSRHRVDRRIVFHFYTGHRFTIKLDKHHDIQKWSWY